MLCKINAFFIITNVTLYLYFTNIMYKRRTSFKISDKETIIIYLIIDKVFEVSTFFIVTSRTIRLMVYTFECCLYSLSSVISLLSIILVHQRQFNGQIICIIIILTMSKRAKLNLSYIKLVFIHFWTLAVNISFADFLGHLHNFFSLSYLTCAHPKLSFISYLHVDGEDTNMV